MWERPKAKSKIRVSGEIRALDNFGRRNMYQQSRD